MGNPFGRLRACLLLTLSICFNLKWFDASHRIAKKTPNPKRTAKRLAAGNQRLAG